ncbi:glutathione S-transferase family protein [Shewanella morhuae]|uniref:glutathione transferase n=1 Tax=Shewanella morhuae TaxID=365591 RepID=A0ABX5HTV2_9GAMM|nr:glutathione S-transferase family protein [Shewanella morhuae]PTA50321.1 glutathione S-transferase family protein [Shewanella morhuae]GIU07898.1 glutathione S-transferase [Shewanella morhuae]
MNLTVYGVPLSPYVRKLRLCLAEKALDYQLVMVLPFDQPAWFKDLNPLGRIPAMTDGDLTLADSSVICQYLEDKYNNLKPLLGQTAEQHAKVRWLEKYADYELAPLTTFMLFQQRIINPSMGQHCNEDIVQSVLSQKLPVHFDYLEQSLGSAEFFVGGSLSLADLAFASQMVNMEHAGEQLDAKRWPNLFSLYSRIKARPSLQNLLAGEQEILTSMKPVK